MNNKKKQVSNFKSYHALSIIGWIGGWIAAHHYRFTYVNR